jgi:hypothetical protein
VKEEMQQPHLTTYAEIAEVRIVPGAAACNQLLADGWVLLGVYPLTTVVDMTPRDTEGEGERKQDIQRYVRRGSWGMLLVGGGNSCLNPQQQVLG